MRKENKILGAENLKGVDRTPATNAQKTKNIMRFKKLNKLVRARFKPS